MDSVITLYHGSGFIIDSPTISYENPRGDFGNGLYLTFSKEKAAQWACADQKDGFINTYEINTDRLYTLDLRKEPDSMLSWLAVVFTNRTFAITTREAEKLRDQIIHKYLPERYSSADVIIGPRADESFFSAAERYLRREMTVETLTEMYEAEEDCIQFVIKSNMAMSRIKYMGSTPVSSDTYYPGLLADDISRREVFDEERVYFLDFLEETGNMFDFAVNSLNFDPDAFLMLFVSSGIAEQLEKKNPKYLGGMSGPELALEILGRATGRTVRLEGKLTAKRKPEYHIGRAYAYIVTMTGHRFTDLFDIGMNYDLMMELYEKFGDNLDKYIAETEKIIRRDRDKYETRLKKARLARGLSQSELAEVSGVTLRMIQLYEQRQNDISKAQAATVIKLANSLGVSVESLMEI